MNIDHKVNHQIAAIIHLDLIVHKFKGLYNVLKYYICVVNYVHFLFQPLQKEQKSAETKDENKIQDEEAMLAALQVLPISRQGMDIDL